MKDSLLLLMTPSMSLKKWNNRGQLSRELELYKQLCFQANLKLIIFSYGRNDVEYLKGYTEFTVLNMPSWIPTNIPFKIQNLIYHITSLFYYRKYFKRAIISKTNQFRSAEFGLLLKLVYGIPLIIRMGFYYSHFKGLAGKKKWQERFAFKFSDLIITTSSEAAEFIEKTHSIPSNKILWMCNSIDLNRFKPMIVDKVYDMIFVGKLEYQKNVEFLLETLKGSNIRSLIIGKGSLVNKVKEAVKNHANINWLERVDNKDLPEYYNSAKCFVLPSVYEGNPKVLLEAMACGLPCLITKVPGIRECIQNNVTGIFIEQDTDAARQKILELITDNDTSTLIGENAFNWVNEHSNAQKNIEKEIIAYTQLIGYDKFPNVDFNFSHNTFSKESVFNN